MANKSSDPTSWWYYFEKSDDGKRVKCKHCTWEKPREKTASTNQLKAHLESKHPEQFSQKLEAGRIEEKKKLEKEQRIKRNTLTDHFQSIPKIPRLDEEGEKEQFVKEFISFRPVWLG
jgi:hypothetical protein